MKNRGNNDMYKKISNYVCFVFLSGFFGVTFGMERERALVQLMRKEVVPILALNDYVMPVSSAYDALKREACMPYEKRKRSQKELIKKVRKAKRKMMSQDGACVYKVYIKETCNEMFKHMGHFDFRNMEIICSPSSTHAHAINADINRTYYQYLSSYSSSFKLKWKRYKEQKEIIERVNSFWHAMVHSLPKGHVVHIEICSPDRVSDWVTIKNLYDPTDLVASQESLEENDIDLLAMDMHYQERFSYIVIAVFTVLSRAVLSHFFC